MSYLVLARKYRPGTFDEIVGQEHVVRTLKNAIDLDRVHHAFLFTGARGVGKTTTARVLARALNCEKGPTTTPCGECPACTEIASSNSPDVLEIDGASNRGVENVRELRETVRYLPSRGRHKLYIIDEVHQLTSEAFNALLKTLEEPPSHVKFIFATTEPQRIPATILSRCQRFDFRRVGVTALSEHLRHVLDAEDAQLSTLALSTVVREAQGSVRDALSLLDQVLSYAGGNPQDAQVIEALGVVDRGLVFDLCSAVLGRDGERILKLVGEVDARGHDLSDLAGLLVEHARDLMVVKVVDNPAQTLLERSPGEIEALRDQAAKLSRPDLHRYFTLLVRVADDVTRSSFQRVSLEMGLLRLLEVEPSHSLGSLLKKIDEVVAAGGAGADSQPPSSPGSGSAASPIGSDRARAQQSAGSRERQRLEASRDALDSPASEDAALAGVTGGAPDREAMVSSGEASAHAGGSSHSESSQPPPISESTETAVPGRAVQGRSATAAEAFAEDAEVTASGKEWPGLVARVRQMRPALASVLEHGRPLRFEAGGVEIGFPSNTFYLESAREPENRGLFEDALRAHFGKKVPCKLVPLEVEGTAEVESLAERGERRQREHEKNVRENALEHPAVRGAIDILGGEVKEVIPLSSSRD